MPANFMIKGEDGKNYWISRSIAVVGIPLFYCNNLIYVPMGKRSENMNLYPNFWGIPCGFLDWGESAAEAIEREIFEELGINISDYSKIATDPDKVITTPNPAENETVSLRFIIHCYVNVLPKLTPNKIETTEVDWMQVSTDKSWKANHLAFNHAEIIDWALESTK
jgi:ADP-ribose pyrophosphatase YjhB (NUDIX family)